MEGPSKSKRAKSPLALKVLLAVSLIALGGIVYTLTADTPPAWLSFLIPGSQYKDPNQAEDRGLSVEPQTSTSPATLSEQPAQEAMAQQSAAVRQSISQQESAQDGAPAGPGPDPEEKVYAIPPPYDSPQHESPDSPAGGEDQPAAVAEAPGAAPEAQTPPATQPSPAPTPLAGEVPVLAPEEPETARSTPVPPAPGSSPRPEPQPSLQMRGDWQPDDDIPLPTEAEVPAGRTGSQALLAESLSRGLREQQPRQQAARHPQSDREDDESDLPRIPAPVRREIRTAPNTAIMYGKARPLNTAGSAVRGSIPESQSAPDAVIAYGGNTAGEGSLPIPPREDSVVPVSFVDDLASFLAENYWPRGTHPLAGEGPITTASIKLANMKYGGQLHGFNPNPENPAQQRQQVLQYVFLPSMLHGLYAVYSPRFIEALDARAHAQTRGDNEEPLSDEQIGQMYGLYAQTAKGLAEAVRSFSGHPENRRLVAAYARSSEYASEVYRKFTESKGENSGELVNARRYQEAVVQREQRREELASALRSHGALQSLDSDTLVYMAQWLYRRGEGKEQSFRALASVLDACAARLKAAQQRYAAPPVTGAGIQAPE